MRKQYCNRIIIMYIYMYIFCCLLAKELIYENKVTRRDFLNEIFLVLKFTLKCF
jgi:hypothetical protein